MKEYLKEIAEVYTTGRATEQSYYPALKRFLERFTRAEIIVVPKKTEAGIPDFLIRRKNSIVGYIEAKEPRTRHLDQVASTEQLKRYKDALPNLILTNFLEFILYRDNKEIMRAEIAQPVGLELGRLIPTYRKRYAEFLRIDFPRIPFTKDYRLFKKTAELGKELIDLHLLKSEKLKESIARYPVSGTDMIKKVKYDKGKVYINDSQYFEGIPEEVWEYRIGSYQVLQKWLKDRKGRRLTLDDIKHYLKITTAIKETIKMQERIDKLYPDI